MIQTARILVPNTKTLVQRNADFTADGAPPPGQVSNSVSAMPDKAKKHRPQAGSTSMRVKQAGSAPMRMAQQYCASLDDVGIDDCATPQAATPGPPSKIAASDWGILLSAVSARLRLTVNERQGATVEPHGCDATDRIRSGVLQCAEDLDLLHGTLAQELGRCQQLELQVFDAQAALACSRAELVGTQAGERRAHHLARHDSLTSLPNRSFFREQLDLVLDCVEPRQALAVLYLDLDGFKSINDAHGHDVGDDVLSIVAVRLTRAVRDEDMVCRLGGDEFACLLGGLLSREQLSQLACKLFDSVSSPLQIGKLRLAVRPSIGIAMCPTDGATTQALLRNADAAMYRAKRQRTGYAFFERLAEEV